ncbi:hypothetical protein JCM8097_009152 [Rhodosporidiobolus ruineniae]
MSSYRAAFAPVPSTSKHLHFGTTSPSSAASSAAPYPLARRDSTCSTYSTASSSDYDTDDFSDDELKTPEASPELRPVNPSTASNGKGKQRAQFDLSASFSAFSLAGIDEDDTAVPVEWTLPSPTSTPAALPSPGPSPAPAPTPLTPSAAFAASHPPAPSARPAPESPPSQPPRTDEDSQRGRSRWPRLLWRSELDMDSLTVLRDYHERAVGGPLPVLKKGMREREVRRWSYLMEGAGL